MLSECLGTAGDEQRHTHGFHLVNAFLHGIVSDLVTEVSAFVLSEPVAQIVFALHPVHAEAVSNITSRGEILMSIFFLLAFLSLAHNHPSKMETTSLFYVYLMPWLGMMLSLFSKEQGATALITITVWDFVTHQTSVLDFARRLFGGEWSALSFLVRTIVLAIQTVLVVALRVWLNGESKPDFVYEQNPAGLNEDRFIRVFSVNWIYILYLRDAVYPWYLAPDWSGDGIELITSLDDSRVPTVLMLWAVFALMVYSLFVGQPEEEITESSKYYRKGILISFFGFSFSPFLLSSNLLVAVGLAKADRVIYLPVMGMCLLQGLLFQYVFISKKPGLLSLPGTRINGLGYLLVWVQLFAFSAKLHERNVAWSDPLYLWRMAYEVNSRSLHTRFNCAYELNKKLQRYEEVEFVMRDNANPHVGGAPTDSFLYAMALRSLGRCDEALDLIEESFYAIKLYKEEGGLRNTDERLARSESDLLVGKSLCTEEFALKALYLYEAVKVDPTNGFAIDSYTKLMEHFDQMTKLMAARGMS